MKVKTNIRAGAKSGTAAGGRDPSKPPSTDSTDVVVVTPAPTPVTYTRCVGI